MNTNRLKYTDLVYQSNVHVYPKRALIKNSYNIFKTALLKY